MVAVKTRDAERYLASPPDGLRLFLVYGSDPGAITERARRIERLALERGKGDSVTRVGSDELSADPGRIADEAYAASLFGGEPVVSIRVLDGRHNVFGALQSLLTHPPEAGWVIVEAAELAPTSPLRKAFEASKHAAALATYPLEGEDLAALVDAEAEERGAALDGDARALLVENLGGDRLAVRGELEKLFLYLGDEKRVTVAAVEAIVGDTNGAKTDAAIDAALLGDHEALELALLRVRAEGSSLGGLATLALRHLFQLQSLSAAIDSGTSVSRAVEYARPPVFIRRRPSVEAALKRWPGNRLAEARRILDSAVMLMRTRPVIEDSALSDALHRIARLARQSRPVG